MTRSIYEAIRLITLTLTAILSHYVFPSIAITQNDIVHHLRPPCMLLNISLNPLHNARMSGYGFRCSS